MKIKHYFICGMVLLAVAGCSDGVKKTLGFKRNVPDEFRVISRPPLSIPPDFALRPPLEGEEAQISTTREDARQSLITDGESESQTTTTGAVPTPKVTTSNPVSSGEQQFLNNIGADQADQDIKEILYNENQEPEKKKTKLWDKILQKDKADNSPDPIVDASKESERIKGNIQGKKTVDGGDTPTVQPKQTLWQRIFKQDE